MWNKLHCKFIEVAQSVHQNLITTDLYRNPKFKEIKALTNECSVQPPFLNLIELSFAISRATSAEYILIGVRSFVSLQHMVQAGVGAFPAAPGFPGAGGAQTVGAGGQAGTVAAPTSDGNGLSMAVKNAAAVAAVAAAQAAQDSQMQHQLKQQEGLAQMQQQQHPQAPGTQVRERER